MSYIIVESVILAATAFHWDTPGPTLDEAFITETSLRAELLTGFINATGTGVATVSTAQLIMAVGWTVQCLISEKRDKWH